jgi:EAL domain-containing protein (putative c-di-GMP-specific phosphodiesterase class I)
VALIINTGHDLVAEGVETEDQLQFLEKRNCQEVQGYYFSKPLPAESLQPSWPTGKYPETRGKQKIRNG